MRHSLLIRIKAFFERDKYSFWWNELTDRDKYLASLSTRELAGELRDARTQRNSEEEIVIEHMLGQRLSEIQTKATWGAAILGFIGALIGAALSVGLTNTFDENNECVDASANNHTAQQIISTQVQINSAKTPSGASIDIPRKNHE